MKGKSIILTALALLTMYTPIFSQTDERAEITVKITKEINGEKQFFKGEYNSVEEMKTDTNYQAFTGEDHDINFWFDDDEEEVFLYLDQSKNHLKSFFHFFDGDEEEANRFHFKHFDRDSVDGFFDRHLNDMEELKEQMKKMRMELDVLIDRLRRG